VFGIGLFLLLARPHPATYGQDNRVRCLLKPQPVDRFIDITIGGKPFTIFYYAQSVRPFFGPLRDRDGNAISQPVAGHWRPLRFDSQPPRGLSFAVDRVNGIDYWSGKGGIHCFSIGGSDAAENSGQFKFFNSWLDNQHEHLLVESTTVRVYANRLISYDATLEAKKPVTFEDTTEGLFGLRLVESIAESAGGKVVSSDTHVGTGQCSGKSFDWVDYSGPVGSQIAGVAIFDNPRNFRRSCYRVATDGLFTINPFHKENSTTHNEPAKPVQMGPGDKLRLRYAVYLHDGDAKAANVANVYRVYVEESRD
jgi:Methane oxygenase PmoA